MPTTDPAPRPSSQPVQFSMRTLLASSVVLVLMFSVWGWLQLRIIAPRRHSDAVERLIESLAERRPSNMTRGQWASAVAWTRNLHGNSLLMFEVDGPAIEAFEQRLRARLAGNVDMETIDWIWCEYANLCPHGASFQRFKPQMQEEMDSVGPNDDPWRMNVP